MSDVTRILDAVRQGDLKAVGELLPLVYDQLRRLADGKLAQEKLCQTLQPTALVHEAWLGLVAAENQGFEGRGHFFAAAAESMRRVLIEPARQKMSVRLTPIKPGRLSSQRTDDRG